MRYLPGSSAAIRAAARDAAALQLRAKELEKTLDSLIGNSGDAGTFSGGERLRKVLVQHRATVHDAIGKAGRVHSALETLASKLDEFDGLAADIVAIPNAASMQMALAYKHQADLARLDAAAVMNHSLPSGVTARLIEYPGLSTTLNHIWQYGVVDTLEGLWGLAKASYDLSPLRAALDPRGYAESWKSLASATRTLYQAVVLDRYPDGSSGARQAVADALKDIPDALMNKDLLDSDPAAWFVIYGATVASLLFGAGEAKIGSKMLASLRKGFVSASDLAKIGDLAGDTSAVAKATDTSRAFRRFPLVRLEYPLTDVSGTEWLRAHPHDMSGRFQIEDVVLGMLQEQDPNFYKLYRQNHDVIDISNVDLVDPGDGRVVSVGSIDPSLPSYAENPSAVAQRLIDKADALRNWATRSNPGGTGTPFISDPRFASLGAEQNTVFFMNGGADYLTRELYFALPSDGVTGAHAKALSDAVAQIEKLNHETGVTVNVHIVEVPR